MVDWVYGRRAMAHMGVVAPVKAKRGEEGEERSEFLNLMSFVGHIRAGSRVSSRKRVSIP